jgi:hypothetical protein
VLPHHATGSSAGRTARRAHKHQHRAEIHPLTTHHNTNTTQSVSRAASLCDRPAQATAKAHHTRGSECGGTYHRRELPDDRAKRSNQSGHELEFKHTRRTTRLTGWHFFRSTGRHHAPERQTSKLVPKKESRSEQNAGERERLCEGRGGEVGRGQENGVRLELEIPT